MASGGPASESVESAGRLVDQHLKADQSHMELSGQLRIATHQVANSSGEYDYPDISAGLPGLSSLPLLGQISHSPLPPELLQEFQLMQCNCSMGLVPEIKRAWLTIDSTIYMWNFEDGKDLAYFDGLSEVVLAAGVVLPKYGVFQEHIKFLLCLSTAVEIVILGVSFTGTPSDPYAEMHLQPEPLFHLPTDNVAMVAVEGTSLGRIFLAGKDGCLYEVAYQAAEGWFSSKCRKINHSVSRLSFLVPSFLSFSEEDPLVQVVVDDCRQILYTRSENSTIQVYDMDADGCGLTLVAGLSSGAMMSRAGAALRSADRSLVKPVVHISVLPPSESSTLHLMAVTKAGVRFYFTTTPDGIVARPSLLALVHARLPPGFSPSSSGQQRPGNAVHQAFYRRGALVLAASQSEEKDVLWIVDSELFPFQTALIESQVTVPLNGRTWAIAESIEAGELEAISSLSALPPSVVTQHAYPPRRLVLLTTQGSYLVTKLRPVDQLQSLLEASKSGRSEAIDAFFKLHKETEACAMCLILATGANQQVAVWATEAFFEFGGEPHFILPTTVGPTSQQQVGGASPMQTTPTYMYSGGAHQQQYSSMPPVPQASASPHIVGPGITPSYGYRQQQQQQIASPLPPSSSSSPSSFSAPALGRALLGPEVQQSGKHNGLCRYLARLLRPLWNQPVVVVHRPPGDIQNEQYLSSYSSDELLVFLEQMCGLRSFLDRNPQLFSVPTDSFSSAVSPSNMHKRLLNFMRPEGMPTDSPAHAQHSLLSKFKADAHVIEHNSLEALHWLVVRCCECLALWRLLCEHQLQLTAGLLTPQEKLQLKGSTFKILAISGKQLTSGLISTLLSRYAGDTQMTESLSARLREMTPSLYSLEDAIASKAQELVTMATTVQGRYEQLTMLRESLEQYFKVSQQITLPGVCAQYKTLRFHEGVVKLALCAASKKDPKNLALHFYKSGQPQDDIAGQKAYMERQSVYVCITGALSELLNAPPQSSLVPTRPGPPSSKPDGAEAHNPRKEPSPAQFEAMLALALREGSSDELFHVILYSWLLSVGLTDKLIEIKSPYLEGYLQHTAALKQDASVLDLLWRFYEKNKNYGSAARILDQLAHQQGAALGLEERLEYMSRAVMCAKSCNMATAASRVGELLHELEEKMEVARLQMVVLDALRQLGTSEAAAAVSMLNAELMDISKLYGDFAEPFRLADCKLAIVHCAGHDDPTLVESLWREIIENELRVSTPHGLRSKLVGQGQLYARSERFFPLSYLALRLEQEAARSSWPAGFVHQTLQDIGVSLPKLFAVYNQMFKEKDQFWQSVGQPLHVLDAIHSLLDCFAKNPALVPVYERASFKASVLDAISHYLVELQTLDSHSPTTASIRTLQTDIQRLC